MRFFPGMPVFARTEPTLRSRTSHLAAGVGVGVVALGLALSASSAMALPTPDSGPEAGGTVVTVPVPGPDSFIQVAAGGTHTLALDAAGAIWSWGSDNDGQLGNGSTTGSLYAPAAISVGATEFTTIEAGQANSLAIDTDGNLWSWGDNANGHAGAGTTGGTITTPTQISSGTVFTAIAVGSFHSLALDSAGTLWTWGRDDSQQLGNGPASGDVTEPIAVATTATFSAISGGGAFSIALDTDGNIWSWGTADEGQLGDGGSLLDSADAPTQATDGSTTYSAIAAGYFHSLALDDGGDIWGWGSNFSGRIGNGDPNVHVAAPVKITTTSNFISVAAGAAHSLALDDNGTLWGWGWNSDGQAGTTSTAVDSDVPEQVSTSVPLASIDAGYFHSVALDVNGQVWAWGLDYSGQVGNGSPTGAVLAPLLITTGPTEYSAVAAGVSSSIAIDVEGNLWSWGEDTFGQLGNGTTTGVVTSPHQISTGTVFTAISVGYYHALALDSDGSVWAWGLDIWGQLGNGAGTGTVTVPTQIAPTVTYSAIAAAGYSSFAIDTDGALWSWGKDDSQQLGNGSTSGDVAVPTELITGSTVFSAVAAGTTHALAVDSNGNLWGWGSNSAGQTGNGAAVGNVDTPTQVSSGTVFLTIEAGDRHSLALDASGNLWTWGSDSQGQLGNGAALNSKIVEPTAVSTGASYVAIAAGDFNSLALDSSGALWGWGSDQYGQSGNGSTTSEIVDITHIPTETPFASIDAGYLHSHAIDPNGNLWSFGRNDSAQLGIGAAGSNITQPMSLVDQSVITSITFDGVAGTNLTRLSNTSARVTSPAGTAGDAAVIVNYSYNGAVKAGLALAHPFTYVAAATPAAGGGSSSGSSTGTSSSTDAPTNTLESLDTTADDGDSDTLSDAAPGTTPTATPSAEPLTDDSPVAASGPNWFWIIIGGVSVLLVVGVGWFLLGRRR